MRTIISYDEEKLSDLKDFQIPAHNEKIWFDLQDPDNKEIENFSNKLKLNKDAVELCLNRSKKPQIRLLDNHTFSILLDIKYESQTVETDGVYLFCGKNWLLTIHSKNVDLVSSTRKLLEQENKKILKDSIEALFYSILSELIGRYEQVLTAVELTVTDLEEKSLTDPQKETLEYLNKLSRQLIVFRRHFWRIRDVVNFLTHMEEDKDEIKYVQTAYDNISQLIELAESYRDTINSVRDLYIANISLQMNDTMKTLTIFATVLLPLTLVTGIYGMNGVDLNKFTNFPSGFIVIMITMVIIAVLLFFLFNKKKWLKLKVRGKSPNKNEPLKKRDTKD